MSAGPSVRDLFGAALRLGAAPLTCGNTHAAAGRARLIAPHDNGIDQMYTIAAAFNRELGAFGWHDEHAGAPDQVRDVDDLVHH